MICRLPSAAAGSFKTSDRRRDDKVKSAKLPACREAPADHIRVDRDHPRGRLVAGRRACRCGDGAIAPDHHQATCMEPRAGERALRHVLSSASNRAPPRAAADRGRPERGRPAARPRVGLCHIGVKIGVADNDDQGDGPGKRKCCRTDGAGAGRPRVRGRGAGPGASGRG
jgi:hypothetical protein